ncbi:MAG TPA: hypothetical protein VN723_13210 [Rhizomicrobium sp.]|jgi:hypothetical protein|nr:hypothetical protein [Rhizomicrobium sp.]
MLKTFLRASALASALAIGLGMTAGAAFAYSEEDAAVPQGSFTSDMAVPMSIRAENESLRHQWFARHMRERMMRRAALERAEPALAR